MKKILITIIILLGSISYSFAQQPKPHKRPKQVKFKPKKARLDGNELKVEHLPGENGVDFFVYKGEKTTMVGGGYIHYILKGFALKAQIAYEKGSPFQIPYEAYYVKVVPHYNLIKIKSSFYLNFNAGGVMAYDLYSAYEPLDEKLNFGVLIGMELEYTIGKVAILANLEQQYVQTARLFGGGGLRYFF
ncbi:hypothetical protein [Flexithrix dorotheae]|uniref:hypothetical protein n=1 Tax=Flexithrix dorotheae TaxID=70993 RepID=UPI000369D0FF|nr:hypothetical protein [Flexithrix dorotheae]